MGPLCRTLTSTALISLGVLFFTLGFVVKFSLFPALLEAQVYENLKIKNGTEGYDAFVEPPVPVFMKFRFFNVTNPEGVKNGDKPELNEIGPYAYKEVRRKENILELDNDKIQFGQYMEYHFDLEETEASGCNGCNDMDKITVLNGALFAVTGLLQQYMEKYDIDGETTIGEIIEKLNIDLDSLGLDEDTINMVKPFSVGFFFIALDGIFNGNDLSYKEEVCVTTTVDGLLYSGYPSKLLHAIGHLVELLSLQFGIEPALTEQQVCEMLPGQVSDCEFGIFKGQNATKEKSYYTINNGRNVKGKFNSYEAFNGKSTLPEEWWPRIGPTPSANESGLSGVCHDIYGTDGAQFPPFVDKEERKWVFVSQLCRSIWLDFNQTVEVRGIEAYRYRPPFSVYDMRRPDNYCYCPEINECITKNGTNDEWNPDDCYQYCRDGFLRVGNCYGGIPIIMTAPHFLKADPDLVNQVIGVSPDIEKHDTYLDIEPITGVALSAHKRIQINFPVKKFEYLGLTRNLPTVDVFPVLWADEGADLDEKNEKKFKDAVIKPSSIVNGLSIGLGIVFGAILFIIGVFIIARSGSNQKDFH